MASSCSLTMRLTAILLAVLLPSVSAAADCSFILWAEDSWFQHSDKFKANESVSWTLITTESSLAQCQSSLGAKIESYAETLRNGDNAGKVEIKGNILSEKHEAKENNFYSYHSIRYICAPDKIDPRPKAR